MLHGDVRSIAGIAARSSVFLELRERRVLTPASVRPGPDLQTATTRFASA
jgi:hypothetical protein